MKKPLIIALMVGIIAAGLFAFFYEPAPQQEVDIQIVTPDKNITEETFKAENWKTFVSEKESFQLKYPEPLKENYYECLGLYYKDNLPKVFKCDETFDLRVNQLPSKSDIYGCVDPYNRLKIKGTFVDPLQSLDDYVNDRYNDELLRHASSLITKGEYWGITGYEFNKKERNQFGSDDICPENRFIFIKSENIKDNDKSRNIRYNNLWVISYTLGDPTLESIFSTLEFNFDE